MQRTAGVAKTVQAVIGLSIVSALLVSTVAAIAAAEGMATIDVEVEFRSPRADAACIIRGQLVSPEESGGYGYESDPVGSYGYTFVNWLQNGYGYDRFDFVRYAEGHGATLHFEDVPVGVYRVLVWCDVHDNGAPEDHLEPTAFAETGSAPDGSATLITVHLNDHVTARAVLAEAAGSAAGHVLDTTGAPIEGAIVIAGIPPETEGAPVVEVARATTDPTGFYVFQGTNALPTGLYYELPYSFQASFEVGEETLLGTAQDVSVGSALALVPTLRIELPPSLPTVTVDALTAAPVDDDADGRYDRIHVEATVTVSQAEDLVFSTGAFASGTPIDGAVATTREIVFTTSVIELDIPGETIALGSLDPTTIRFDALTPDTFSERASRTLDTDLGSRADYAPPAIVMGTLTLAPFDDASDADTLYDGVRATLTFSANEPVSASAYVQLMGEGDAPLSTGFAFLDPETYTGDVELSVDIPAARIVSSELAPRSGSFHLLSATSGFPLGLASATFDGGALADYEQGALALPDGSATYATELDDAGKIERLSVRVEPQVFQSGQYRFAARLATSDNIHILAQLEPAIGTLDTIEPGDVIEIVFEGGEIADALPSLDWSLARIDVEAYDDVFFPIAQTQIAVSPPIARDAFARQAQPLDLPAEDSADLVVTCGADHLACDGTRPATGWSQLNLRFPILVNLPGAYGFSGDLAAASGQTLAEASNDPASYPLGTSHVELTFDGRDIAANGAIHGDPANVRIDAWTSLYEHLGTTRKTITGIPAAYFEGLGIQMHIGTATIEAQDLVVPVTLTHVGRAGEAYQVQLLLVNATDSVLIGFETRDVILPDSGPLDLAMTIDGETIYAFLASHGLESGSFRLLAFLTDPTSLDLLLTSEAGPIGPFAATAFPSPPVRILPGATSAGFDSADADELFDELRTSVPLSIQSGHAGAYTASAVVVDRNFAFVTGRSTTFDLTSSLTTIPIELTSFEGRLIATAGLDGPYVTFVSLFAPDGSLVGTAEVASPRYLASQFETGGVRILGITDAASGGPARPGGPGYSGIQLNVNVDTSVEASGLYDATISLYTPAWGFIGADAQSVALQEDVPSISFLVGSSEIRASDVNGLIRYHVHIDDPATGATVASQAGFLGAVYRASEFAIDGLELGAPVTYTDAVSPDGRALRITLNAEVGTPARYTFLGALFTQTGRLVATASTSPTLPTGPASVTIDFDSSDLVAAGAEGPFRAYFTVRDESFAEIAQTLDPKITARYPLSTWATSPPFDITSVGALSERTAAGAITELVQPFTFAVNEPGSYVVRASLLAREESGLVQIAGAEQRITRTLLESGTGSVSLRGADIARGLPPSYHDSLVLEIVAYRQGARLAAVDEVRTTTRVFLASEFFRPVPGATLTNAYTWTPLDERADTRAEVLAVAVGLDVTTGGTFRVDADLTGPRGVGYIDSASVTATLEPGSRTLTLRFDGQDIRRAGLDGNYRLNNLVLYSIDADGTHILATPGAIDAPTRLRAAEFN